MSNAQPIIVLGAARSGTKMLRDTLSAARDLGVVKFDVNYIWRVGNERFPHDGMPADLATAKVSQFIRTQLSRISTDLPATGRFVEKTVGNVLRLPFVHRVYPDAKYVFLIRDGRDVAESAVRCWQSPAKLSYLAAKLKTFPWRHGARYAANYARNYLLRSLNMTSHLSTWGPHYQLIEDHVRDLPLWQVCAHQWIASVEAYEQSKRVLSIDQIVEIRYEDLVANPANCMKTLCAALQIEDVAAVCNRAEQTIVDGNVGKRNRLNSDHLSAISDLQSGVLERWGYRTHVSTTSAHPPIAA